MLKATKDFEEDGVSVKAGEEIEPGQFDADRVVSLLAKGFITDDKPQPAPKAAPKAKK